ncbi:TonB-dependent receptor [Chitinimonas arctica]|uniref:TonB-dependent receptor n=1 Tax=Chitinimonas arctica TaxID=2594795 RepID=A0A516SKS7_9NEIS|nr:TonB-dependent receptor [Chitinimonas arctica]QDQ28628.1 TonB-dependent receptor [Chitinimonas arctica]
MRFRPLSLALLSALAYQAQASDEKPLAKSLGAITVTGQRLSSLPTSLPSTIESVTARQLAESTNATDSEDALKYLPSLNVRKRFNGDYDHAVLASRASGTGNSARSLVYADGILLSNLLGNGASFTPRWGMVAAEEIERVDVLYGPFSAAYPGNSVGAVVDYATRMPRGFEAHFKLNGFQQGYRQYGTDSRYPGGQVGVSLGNRTQAGSWWLHVSRLDNQSQPIAFSYGKAPAAAGTPAVPVSGAVADRNPRQADWWILGATNQVHTVQDHAKIKLSYDIAPAIRASYLLGWWQNTARRAVESYLRDATGQPYYGSKANPGIALGGAIHTLTPADFAPGRGQLAHLMQGLSLKQREQSGLGWEMAASRYDYRKDQLRAPTVFMPQAETGGAGQLTDLAGSGWDTLALKAAWRPAMLPDHAWDMGVQTEHYRLRSRTSRTADWLSGDAVGPLASFRGDTRLRGIYAQDSWRIAPEWRATLGGRLEFWQAYGGRLGYLANPRDQALHRLPLFERRERHFSPKLALAYQATPDWTLKTSLGRAVRMPTVAELYQGTVIMDKDGQAGIVNNDPTLKAERSWTGELTAERALENGTLRTTLFHEDSRDALYVQINVFGATQVSTVQNVAHIRTRGAEIAYSASDVGKQGLDVSGSLTYAHSRIVRNDNFPASVGKWQPRVPNWRANLLATYRLTPQWSTSLGMRYSGKQYGNLDNSDGNGATYTGVSRYFVTDIRTRYRLDKHWSAALGVDNLNNAKYWAYHPYTQRTVFAELRFDLEG